MRRDGERDFALAHICAGAFRFINCDHFDAHFLGNTGVFCLTGDAIGRF
jgi:hypothetical protein